MPLRGCRSGRRLCFSVLRLDRRADDGQADPALGAYGAPAIAKGKHQHQQHNGNAQHKDGQAPEGLVVDLGDKVHGHQAHPAEAGLLDEVVGGVQPLVHGGGVGGGEHRHHADAGEDDHQHEKGNIHGAPGQLLHHRQIPSASSCHAASPPNRNLRCVQRYMTPQKARTHITRVMPVNTQKSLTSLQPPISRWWWRGAMRKIRLPWVSLKYPTCIISDRVSAM